MEDLAWFKERNNGNFPSDEGDRMEIIERSKEATDAFGWHYGGQVAAITLEDIEQLKKGKILAFDINGGEYSHFIGLVTSQVSNKENK